MANRQVFQLTTKASLLGTDVIPIQLGTGASELGKITIGSLFGGIPSPVKVNVPTGFTGNLIDLQVNAVSQFVVKQDGKVGIGTATPGAKLHISSGNTGTTPDANAGIIVERTGNAIIQVMSANGNSGQIYFGSPSKAYGGAVLYRTNTNALSLHSNGLERVTVDGTGKVGIGNTTPARAFVVGKNPTDDSAAATIDSGFSTDAGFVSVSRDSWGFVRLNSSLVSGGMLGVFNFVSVSQAAGTATMYIRHGGGTGPTLRVDDENATTQLIVTANGRVGIGTDAPTSKLHIVTASTENGIKVTGPTNQQAGTYDLIDLQTSTGQQELKFNTKGRLTLKGLPTASTGLTANDVWNNNGVLSIGPPGSGGGTSPDPVTAFVGIVNSAGTVTKVIASDGATWTFPKQSTGVYRVRRNGLSVNSNNFVGFANCWEAGQIIARFRDSSGLQLVTFLAANGTAVDGKTYVLIYTT